MHWLILILFIYVIALGFLIYTRWRNKHILGIMCKSMLGMMFILFSFLLMAYKKTYSQFNLLIAYSLICSAVGDIFLGICKIDIKNKDYYFYFATIIISISQILFYFASLMLTGFNIMPLLLAIVVVTFLYMMFNKICALTSKSKLILLYSYPLTLVMLNNIVGMIERKNMSVLIFGIGSFLYWSSDIVLFIIKFKDDSKILDMINKILYYSAQIFIASCIFFNA